MIVCGCMVVQDCQWVRVKWRQRRELSLRYRVLQKSRFGSFKQCSAYDAGKQNWKFECVGILCSLNRFFVAWKKSNIRNPQRSLFTRLFGIPLNPFSAIYYVLRTARAPGAIMTSVAVRYTYVRGTVGQLVWLRYGHYRKPTACSMHGAKLTRRPTGCRVAKRLMCDELKRAMWLLISSALSCSQQSL